MVAGARAATADDLASARASANKAAAAMSDAEIDARAGCRGQINQLEAQQANAKARVEALRGVVHQIAIHRYINADADRLASLDPDINAQAEANALSRYALQGNQDAIDRFSAAARGPGHRLQGAGRQAGAAEGCGHGARQAAGGGDGPAGPPPAAGGPAQTAAVRTAKLAAASARRPPPRVPRSPPDAWVCPVQGPVAFTDSFGAPGPAAAATRAST